MSTEKKKKKESHTQLRHAQSSAPSERERLGTDREGAPGVGGSDEGGLFWECIRGAIEPLPCNTWGSQLLLTKKSQLRPKGNVLALGVTGAS